MAYRVQPCKKCRQDMVFMKTWKGKWMPVDAETVDSIEIQDEVDFDHRRHTPHFTTCPFADEFRKRKPTQ